MCFLQFYRNCAHIHTHARGGLLTYYYCSLLPLSMDQPFSDEGAWAAWVNQQQQLSQQAQPNQGWAEGELKAFSSVVKGEEEEEGKQQIRKHLQSIEPLSFSALGLFPWTWNSITSLGILSGGYRGPDEHQDPYRGWTLDSGIGYQNLQPQPPHLHHPTLGGQMRSEVGSDEENRESQSNQHHQGRLNLLKEVNNSSPKKMAIERLLNPLVSSTNTSTESIQQEPAGCTPEVRRREASIVRTRTPDERTPEEWYRLLSQTRTRKPFDEEQRAILEASFQQEPIPSRQVKQGLAVQLGISPRKVQIWFQNRRAKERRMLNMKNNHMRNNDNKDNDNKRVVLLPSSTSSEVKKTQKLKKKRDKATKGTKPKNKNCG
jgi:hypothetical protein